MEDKLRAAKELAAKKADELSEQLKIRVHPVVFMTPEDEDPVVGYMKEPSRQVKLAVMDKSLVGMYSAASEMLDIIILKDQSDPRMYSERPEDDKYYLGAVMAAYEIIKVSINQADKKK